MAEEMKRKQSKSTPYTRLKALSKGKGKYKDNDEAIQDMAVLLVEMCERNDELVELVSSGFEGIEEICDTLSDLEEYVYGEDFDLNDSDAEPDGKEECGCGHSHSHHGHSHSHGHDHGSKEIEVSAREDGSFAIGCPVCGAEIAFSKDELAMAETLSCPGCGVEVGISRAGGCGEGCCSGGCGD